MSSNEKPRPVQIEPSDWEQIGNGPPVGPVESSLWRLKIHGGWLVLRAFERTDMVDSMTFKPDPNHEWGA